MITLDYRSDTFRIVLDVDMDEDTPDPETLGYALGNLVEKAGTPRPACVGAYLLRYLLGDDPLEDAPEQALLDAADTLISLWETRDEQLRRDMSTSPFVWFSRLVVALDEQDTEGVEQSRAELRRLGWEVTPP